MVALQFKLLYMVYGTNCTAPIFFILLACFSYFFTLLFCFIYTTFSSFIMAPTKKPASATKAKAKAPSANATASLVHLQPDKAPNKKSTFVKQTSSSKPSISANIDTSISSNSSVSSTHVGDFAILPDVSDFVPTSLPSGHGTIPIGVKHSFQSTLNIMSRINFSTLSKDKSSEWNVALSKSCCHLSKEYSLLKKHFSLFKYSALEMNITTHRQAFTNKMLPLIKKCSHNLFIKLAFPSMIEVTTTNGNALSMFGLTSTSPLARMVCDEFVFKPQGSRSANPISPEDNLLLTPCHEQV
jgi:hypothetical protein